MPGQGGPGDFAAGGMGGLSAAVHAEYVVLQGSEYTTMAEQLGTVSEVSSSSVTVKSSDGFTRSYALGSDVVVSNLQQRRQQAGGTGTQLSVADIVAGGTVRIVAAKDGSGYTASSVMVVAATATGQSN
jgi:ABC-type Fe3+ transport system substrate-binding protein